MCISITMEGETLIALLLLVLLNCYCIFNSKQALPSTQPALSYAEQFAFNEGEDQQGKRVLGTGACFP